MFPERGTESFNCPGFLPLRHTNKQPDIEIMNTTMNAMDITEGIPQQDTATSAASATRNKSQATSLLGRVRLRHGALLGLVLGLVWFALTVQSHITAIEAEMDMIHANLQAR